MDCRGSGRTELAEVIFGLNRKYSGKMSFKGKDYNPHSTNEAIDKGISLVPEDRMKEGLVTIHSILDNLALPNLNEYKGTTGYFKKKKFQEEFQ